MNIKTVAVTAEILSLFAVEAVAQTNHNTTRSNKTSGELAAQ